MILSDEKAEKLIDKSTAYALGIMHGGAIMFIGLNISWVVTIALIYGKVFG